MYSSKASSINDRIAKLEAELEQKKKELAAEVEQASKMTPAQHIAIELHNNTCNSNHIDQCGWAYEINNGIHNWDRGTHKMWLEKAQKTINYYGSENVAIEEINTFIRVGKIVKSF